MATAYDTWLTDAPEPVEIDDVALAALTSHPVMIEEAMNNQDGAFWVKVAHHSNSGSNDLVGMLISIAVKEYVQNQVIDFASDEEISVNEAIHKLLNRCNGGK